MSSLTVTTAETQQAGDNPDGNGSGLDNNTYENVTSDTTSLPTVPATPVVPLVYYPQQAKLPFTSVSKANTLQFTSIQPLNKNNTTSKRSNQGMIFTHLKNMVNTQQIVIAKPGMTSTYVTMFKQPEIVSPIAPMPKVINNRLPVTVTTNSLQPKIAFFPYLQPSTDHQFNFKINNEMTSSEVIDLDSPPKAEKEYELSISEEKKEPKHNKHEISILKRNCDKPRINNNSVLDTEIATKTHQKTERRRKANFSYRKEFDDMEIIESDTALESSDITLTKMPSSEQNLEVKKEDRVEIELIKESKSDISTYERFLKWEDQLLASFLDTNLKFIRNEYGFMEYYPDEDYKKMKNKNEQEYLRCVECGCYGLPSEFVTEKYCGLACQQSGLTKETKDKEVKLSRRRKTTSKTSKRAEPEQPSSYSDEDNTSNENSQDRSVFPWTCAKKGFSWAKYLEFAKAKAAPLKLFKEPFPYGRNHFRTGMRLEGIDPVHPSYFCVLSVADVCGYRLRLHFDGYSDSYDFWVNADSSDIFPVGWCEKHGHVLQPPRGYTVQNFNWMHYLKQVKATAAPKHLFANRDENSICPNGFRIGMKLEAVDRTNTTLVGVATVRDMMDNRILVHFDSWDDIYDYWADPTSPYIHPVGWCDQYGHSLTPPNESLASPSSSSYHQKQDYPNPENFSWEKYLKETKSVAAPARAFKQRPTCGFKKGMRLECVDKRVPQLIRVATIDDVRDHQIRIRFDGWPDRYSYWVDDDCTDIHPIEWCYKTGHPIEIPPLITSRDDDVYNFSECPTIGCKGAGHIEGSKFATHTDQKHCPYSDENLLSEKVLPDRLLSPNQHVEAVVPVQREPRDKTKPRLGRPPKYLKVPKREVEEDTEKKPKRQYRKRLKLDPDETNKVRVETIAAYVKQLKAEPTRNESWIRHIEFLKYYLRNANEIRQWNENKVANLISTVPGCECRTNNFIDYGVDGEALLALSQEDLIKNFRLKMGPALKLYNIIVLLRQKVGYVPC